MEAKQYNFWELTSEYHLVFPRIQRDYAQGRNTPKAQQVRKSFLDNLENALKENKEEINLDFIYGVQKKGDTDGIKYFTALDGQQRLTTLFLLHWYLAYQSGNLDKLKEHLRSDSESKVRFLYETRDSAKDFCKDIILNGIDDGKGQGDEKDISWKIKNQSWFLTMWIDDPTVSGMLTMLDAMNEKFKDSDYLGYFNKLTQENGFIRFYVLPFDDNFTLGDDLYVKMNARGLPLTTFENFKASFEEDFLNDSSLNSDFKKSIDTLWQNMFWFPMTKKEGNPPAAVDEEMMRFVRMLLSFNYARRTGNKYDDKLFAGLLINSRGRDFIPDTQQNYAYLVENAILNDQVTAKDVVNGFKQIGQYWDDNAKQWKKDSAKPISFEAAWDNLCSKNGYDYETQLLLLAVIIAPNDGLEKWFRLCRNLICNTRINEKNEMRWFINKLYVLKDKSDFGMTCSTSASLQQGSSQSTDVIVGKVPQNFTSQFEEEQKKFELSKDNKELKQTIEKHEDDPTLVGRIKFLIDYCKSNVDKFNKCAENAIALLKDEHNMFELLLMNDKLSSYPCLLENMKISKQRKEMFGINKIEQFSFFNKGKGNRDFGWHRLLNDEPESFGNPRKDSLSSCQAACMRIIDNQLNLKSSITFKNEIEDWKKMLIDCPDLIKYCKGTIIYRVTFNDNSKRYYLSTGTKDGFFKKKNKISDLYLRYVYEKLNKKCPDTWDVPEWSYNDNATEIICELKSKAGMAQLTSPDLTQVLTKAGIENFLLSPLMEYMKIEKNGTNWVIKPK